jgi:hypothetical protein
MVEDLIQQARRRFILNEAFGQTAFAASVLAAGVILLLIIGTRYLSGWSLAVFAVAGIGVGIYRLRRQTPDGYTTAVRLDESAHLHDALSTAFHFSQHPDSAPASATHFQQAQREQAETAARTVNVSTALPFTLPRAFYLMAALGIAASVLVGLRYRMGHGLDLQRPLTEILFEDQNAARAKTATKARNAIPGEWGEEARDLLSKLGIKPDFDDSSAGEPDPLDKAIEQALQQDNQSKMDQKGGGAQKGGEQGKNGDKGADQKGSDPVDGGDKGADDQKDGGQKSAKNGDSDSQNAPGKNGDSKDGLLSKLKNAVSNMLSKNQPQQGNDPAKAQDQKSASNEKKDAAKQQPGPGQGTPEKGNGDQDSDETDPNGDAMGGQKGKSNESTASNSPQKQEGSGIGLADGSKDIKAAEQLKAMGKISEIIGKRSATVSGETMVEVQSGKQQLKTSYSETRASHAETDGDVTRDEIPLALQPYVQQYFAEVHKAEPAADAGTATKKKSGK